MFYDGGITVYILNTQPTAGISQVPAAASHRDVNQREIRKSGTKPIVPLRAII